MIDFDLAKIVVTEKEATARGRCDRHNVSLTLSYQAGQWRIVAKDKVHLSLQTAGKPLAAATHCGAFGANVVENSVGKGKKDVHQTVLCVLHEAQHNITNRISFFEPFMCVSVLDRGAIREPGEPCNGLGSVYNFRRLGQKTGPRNPATARELPLYFTPSKSTGA